MVKRSTDKNDAPNDLVLSELAATYAKPLTGYFRRRIGASADTEDLVQDVFARLARMKSLESVDNPQAYIFQTASNLLRDRARRAQTQNTALHEPFDDDQHGRQADSPEQILVMRQQLDRMKMTLNELPTRTRNIFLLKRFDGLKHKEIAEILGVSVSTVEKHMVTAIAALAKSMKGGE